MLKKHAQFFESLFIISDVLILSLAWILSYFLRFETTLIKPPLLGTPPFLIYIELLFPLLIIWSVFSKKVQLYRPRRIDHFFKEFFGVVTCLTLTLIILIAGVYIFPRSSLTNSPSKKLLSFEYDVFPLFLQKGMKIRVLTVDAPFIDIDTSEAFREAESFIKKYSVKFILNG